MYGVCLFRFNVRWWRSLSRVRSAAHIIIRNFVEWFSRKKKRITKIQTTKGRIRRTEQAKYGGTPEVGDGSTDDDNADDCGTNGSPEDG